MTLHNSAAASNGTACSIMWLGVQAVACSAPPGAGTAYDSLTVDRQAAEARLPIAYASPSIMSIQPQDVLMHSADSNASELHAGGGRLCRAGR